MNEEKIINTKKEKIIYFIENIQNKLLIFNK